MVERKDIASWLDGPGPLLRVPGEFPGRTLGMPRSGPGSLARFGRRFFAVLVDWLVCTVIAVGLMGYRLGEGGLGPFKPLVVFVLMNLVLVGTLGFTIGHRLFGLRVLRVDGASAGPVVAAVRTVLLAAVIPAVIWDRDNRGFHDKIAGTVLVRG